MIRTNPYLEIEDFRSFKPVLDQVRERIYMIGTDYRYFYANQRGVDFEGLPANEIVGRHVIDLVGPLIFKRYVKPNLDRCFCGEKVRYQHWMTAPSGRRQYCDVLLHPFHEAGDSIVGAVVTISDRTEEKELEEKLNSKTDHYRHVIENSILGIAIYYMGRVVFANQTLKSMFGYEHDEATPARNPLQFVAKHDHERIQSFKHAHRKGYRGPRQYTFDGVHKDGRIINLMASSDDILWRERWARRLVMVDISKQVTAEHALRANAASFRDVIEGSLQGFYAIEGDRYIYVNQAFADLLGYSVEEMKSTPIEMFFAEHERSRTRENRNRRFEKNPASRTYELDALHKDGHIVRVQQCVRLTENWFGKPAILGFVIDVTDRHRAEKALENERYLLRTIIDNIPAVVFAKDLGGKFLIKNKAGAAFVGEADPTSMIGKDADAYYPENVTCAFRDSEHKVMQTGQDLVDLEQKIVSPATGEAIWMRRCLAPLRDADDKIVGVVGVGYDVTAYRQSETALRESEQRFKDIAEVSSDWFWEMDADLRFSYFSDRAAKLSGTDIEETLGKQRSDVAVQDSDKGRLHLEDLKHRRPFRDFRYVKTGNDGTTYYISVSGIPIFDNKGTFKGYRGTGTNITREVETQQALAKERNLLRAIVDNIPDAVYAKDRQARFILMNRNDACLKGTRSTNEVIGKTDFNYYPEAMAQKSYSEDMQVIERGASIINKVERFVRGEDGETFWQSTTKVPLRDERGDVMGLVGISRDITEAKRLSDRLHYQATHDCLTGLLNRGEFERRLALALDAAKSGQRSAVLCYIDLDQFKMLNDSAGHRAGDHLLCQLADIFKEHTDPRGTSLARLGGDEFGLLINHCTLDDGQRIAEMLIEAVNALRFSWEQQSFTVSISVGMTVISERIRSVSDLLARADVACYSAKDSGRNRLCIYRSSNRETRARHEELLRAASLRQAIEKDGLVLFAQPIISLGDVRSPVSHYEILLRLRARDDELLLPGAFIPAAERYGLMPLIDQWVIGSAFNTLSDIAKPIDGQRFNINLSGHSLCDDVFQDSLRHQLTETTIPAESICFEITETAMISNLGRAKRFVGELREIGCRIALDDFGCGLSSFNYLKQFQVDYLKIDGSFVKQITEDETNRAIVEAINHVGHVCKIQTIAECVESDALIHPLRELQVDYAQGFAVGRSGPLVEIASKIRNSQQAMSLPYS